METSLLKTLADKHRSSVTKMARKHKAAIDTPHGPRKCLEARIERNGRKPLVARFGGIPLRRQKDAVLTDRLPVPGIIGHKELVTGSWRTGARSAGTRARWMSTRSASSPISASRDNRGPRGRS